MKAVHSFTASRWGKGEGERDGRRGKDQPGGDEMAEEKYIFSNLFFSPEITGELEGKD